MNDLKVWSVGRSFRPWLLSLLGTFLLAGCVGGREDTAAPQMPLPSQAVLADGACSTQAVMDGTAQTVGTTCLRAHPLLRRQAAVLAAPAPPADALTPDVLMDWAERQYPQLFAPAGSPTQRVAPYVYRHYPTTGNYIGVAGTDIYVLGPISNGQIAFVGTLADFACVAGKISCAVPGAPTITGVTPKDHSATIRFDPPASSGSSPIAEYKVSCAYAFEFIGVASGRGSPITVTGLTNGRKYSCIVTASNAQGPGAPSAAVTVTPVYLGSYQTTSVRLVSEPGDPVGGGLTYEYDKSDTWFFVAGAGNRLHVQVIGDEFWDAYFNLPPDRTSWAPGTYTGLGRFASDSANKGEMDWGRRCNSLTGSITVYSVTYAMGEIDSISMSFVQYCDFSPAALRGTIIWGANDPTQPKGPVVPVPADLWKAAATAVPASGNYVYLQSDPGDNVGGGQTLLYTGPQALQVSGGGPMLTVSAGAWEGTFVPMAGVDLQLGYYSHLRGYGFNNASRGGLEWRSNGRECRYLTGWFAIDDIEYEANEVKRIEMRFTQTCDGNTAALHGQLRWARP